MGAAGPQRFDDLKQVRQGAREPVDTRHYQRVAPEHPRQRRSELRPRPARPRGVLLEHHGTAGCV